MKKIFGHKYLLLMMFAALSMTSCASKEEVIRVTFDGQECTVEGPTEVAAGEQAFILEDLSDFDTDVYLYKLVNGYTYEDFHEYQVPGTYQGVMPSWLEKPKVVVKSEPDNLAENESYKVYSLEEGDHVIAAWISNYDPIQGWAGWPCGPLHVTNSSPE